MHHVVSVSTMAWNSISLICIQKLVVDVSLLQALSRLEHLSLSSLYSCSFLLLLSFFVSLGLERLSFIPVFDQFHVALCIRSQKASFVHRIGDLCHWLSLLQSLTCLSELLLHLLHVCQSCSSLLSLQLFTLFFLFDLLLGAPSVSSCFH